MRRLLILLATLLAVAPTPAKGTLLRVDVEDGTTYRFSVVQEQVTDMSMGTLGQQRTTTKTTMEMRQTFLNRTDEGNFRVEMVYERIAMEIDSGAQTMTFDSRSPASDDEGPMGLLREVLVGRTLIAEVSPRARIVSISGLDEIWDSIGNERTTVDEQMTSALKDSFGPEALRAALQSSAIQYPEKQVSAGETWSNQVQFDRTPLGGMRIDLDYTFVGTEGKGRERQSEITFESAIELTGESPLAEQMRGIFSQQGMEVDIDYALTSSGGSGTVRVDTATGLLNASTTRQTMEFKIDLSMMDQQMSMTMNADQTMTLKRAGADETQ